MNSKEKREEQKEKEKEKQGQTSQKKQKWTRKIIITKDKTLFCAQVTGYWPFGCT